MRKPEVKDALFICRQNVGRSQMAAAFYNHFLPGQAESAGLIVDQPGQKIADWEISPGLRGAGAAIESMKEAGFDISSNQRTRFDESRVRDFARVVILAETAVIPVKLIGYENVVFRAFEDPKGKDVDEIRPIRVEIQEMVEDVILELHPEFSSYRPLPGVSLNSGRQ